MYGIDITIQWVPGHTDIRLNEEADKLAKTGSHMPQENTETTYETAKQMAKQNSKETWYNSWETEERGRSLHKHLPTPNPEDPINKLCRKDQCNIFRLRTGHTILNEHRNRIDPQVPPMCRHCNSPRETVEHHLLHCRKLTELRKTLLPANPTIETCLYGNIKQLENTALYHRMASRVNES